ncbi:Protein of unknown function [Zobellia uliginosa]|uniref:DUF2490 domain-containing protein n=1 Tax=Zobellia uliginosa TaxID=143224 RepID=A0ABY1KJ81_9FLAO|nr:DUF2490 domain-containing protein [Zobellia uliginosa]SIS40890.1 Protein of unknown function [Zobellia uliginosa]
MYYIKRFFIVFGVLMGSLAYCQENLTGYFQPDISLKYKVNTHYSHSFKVAQRAYIYEDDFSYRIRQIDLVHFSSFKVDSKQGLALGVQYRFRESFDEPEENELRIVEQYKYSHRNETLNMGSRFRAEQRISPSLTIHRFRYRLAIDFPLKGEELAVGDPYFSASAEALLSVAKGDKPEYDQRLTSHVGWLLGQGTKLEIGAEYRAEDYTHTTEHIFFLLTSLIFSL